MMNMPLYVTLEQNAESHLRNMNSLGIKKGSNLHIFDYRDMRYGVDEQ